MIKWRSVNLLNKYTFLTVTLKLNVVSVFQCVHVLRTFILYVIKYSSSFYITLQITLLHK